MLLTKRLKWIIKCFIFQRISLCEIINHKVWIKWCIYIWDEIKTKLECYCDWWTNMNRNKIYLLSNLQELKTCPITVQLLPTDLGIQPIPSPLMYWMILTDNEKHPNQRGEIEGLILIEQMMIVITFSEVPWEHMVLDPTRNFFKVQHCKVKEESNLIWDIQQEISVIF